MCRRGMLITIEGIDGSGKSSVAKQVAQLLGAHKQVILTKEPGSTELGKQLRTLLQERTFGVSAQAEFLLFAADRAQHMKEVVIPALEEGKIVLSDRMADSSLAYQGYGRGVEHEWIKAINTWAMDGYEPDLTLYLQIDYQTAARRLRQRRETATVFEQEEALFFERVIQGFETMYRERSTVRTLDATASIEQVSRAAYQEIMKVLPC
jgi:dTMP kinase